MMPKISSKAVWAIAIILAVFVFDQLTKYLILREEAFQAFACLKGEAMCGRIELSSVMDFSMVWNKGFSFGLAQAEGIWRWVLTLAVLCIGGMFLYWLIQAEHTLTAVSLALVVGGALGNLIDRIRFGAVVDFFDFSGPWFGIEFPIPDFLRRVEAIFANGMVNTDGKLGLGFPYVFNIADAAITIGAILLFIDQFLLNRHDADAGKA